MQQSECVSGTRVVSETFLNGQSLTSGDCIQQEVIMFHSPQSQNELSLEQRIDILGRANRLYASGMMPGMIIQAMSRRFARPLDEMEELLQSLFPPRNRPPRRAR